MLNSELIKSYLKNSEVIIDVVEAINSTNDYLKHHYTKSIHVCLAEQQTNGKGRWGRAWYSPFGKNIYFSCRLSLNKSLPQLSGLSLVVTLAVWKTLYAFGVMDQLYVKWPNDILYANQKLSGNLIEIQSNNNNITDLIIGIGINVNMLQDDNSITQDWTSMQKILGNEVDRNKLCAYLINNLLTEVHLFEQQGLNSFIDQWQNIDYLLNKIITIRTPSSDIEGRMIGINGEGHLILQLANGCEQVFAVGEATIYKR